LPRRTDLRSRRSPQRQGHDLPHLLTMWVQLRSSSDKALPLPLPPPSISTSSSTAVTAPPPPPCDRTSGCARPYGRAFGSGGPWLGGGEMNGAVHGQADMGTARRGRGRHGGRQQARLAVTFARDSSGRTCRIAYGRASRQVKMVFPKAHELDSLTCREYPGPRTGWLVARLSGRRRGIAGPPFHRTTVA
jgi:hypothetical protein